MGIFLRNPTNRYYQYCSIGAFFLTPPVARHIKNVMHWILFLLGSTFKYCLNMNLEIGINKCTENCY